MARFHSIWKESYDLCSLCLPSLACLVFVNFIHVVACSCGLIFVAVEHSIGWRYHCVSATDWHLYNDQVYSTTNSAHWRILICVSVDRRMHFCWVESESEVRHIRSFKNAVGFLQRLHQFPISRAVNGDLSHSVSPSTLAIPCALRFSHAGGCLLTLDYAFNLCLPDD